MKRAIVLLFLLFAVLTYDTNAIVAVPGGSPHESVEKKINIHTPIYFLPPEGWHFGFTSCVLSDFPDEYHRYTCFGDGVCVKWKKGSFLSAPKCLKVITFNDFVKKIIYKNNKNIDTKVIGIIYHPYYGKVYIYYIWKTKNGK